MSQYVVRKSSLQGKLSIPPSKSQTLRAIVFAALAEGKSIIHHYLPSSDVFHMIKACELLGASIHMTEETIEIAGISGKIGSTDDVIDAGNSGIVLRFFSAIGALGNHPIVITGDHSIRHQRPMKALLSGLAQLHVSAKSMRGDGFAPVIVQGPITPGVVYLSGEDSQPISALIIASAFAEGPIEIHVMNPGEKPWIDMTLSWLDKFKIPYERSGYEYYKLYGRTKIQGFEYTVPGDFSSAAFPIAAALITQSDLILDNIDMQDPQGDKQLIEVFQNMGAHIDINAKTKTLHVRKESRLFGKEVDINDFVDAITILAVVACYAEGDTLIYNGAVAKQKECNRIHSIYLELKKMGADIEERPDGLLIKRSRLKGTSVNSYHDHRMVMSLTVAALGAEGQTHINDTTCVAKTFPTFQTDFKNLGADIEVIV